MAESLTHYLKTWKLSRPRPLAETVTSRVYTVAAPDGPAVLKVLTPLGRKDEGAAAAALTHFDGHGAVRLLRHDEGAQLLEYAEGEDLKALVARGQDNVAAAIAGDVLNRLHGAPGEAPTGLVPLPRWFRGLFSRAGQDRDQGRPSLYCRAASVAETLLSKPLDGGVLHGDIHHENIRHAGARGWLAIDPKGLYGERTFDAANLLLNPADIPALVHDETRLLKIAAILARTMALPLPRLLLFAYAYAALSASWSLEDGDDPAHPLKVAEMLELHLPPV